MSAGSAQALGFGRVANSTQLGQRLNFAAQVRLDPGESLERPCVFAEVLAGDNLLQPGQVRVTLEGGPDGSERSVRVTTSTVIDEPVVTVTVTVGCDSRATRKFVVFVDPPGIDLAQSAPADSALLLLPQRADSQVAPLVAIVSPEATAPADGAAPAPRESRPPPSPSPVLLPLPAAPRRSPQARADAGSSARRSAAAPASSPTTLGEPPGARKSAPVRRTVTAGAGAARPTGGGRLQLEAAPALAAAAPTRGASAAPLPAGSAPLPAVPAASATAPMALASAPAAGDLQAALLAREQQRIQTLEEGMARMRADAAATQKTLADVQARLRTAESDRNAKPLALGVAALGGVLAMALVALLWRRSRASRAAHWWAGAPAAGNPAAGVPALGTGPGAGPGTGAGAGSGAGAETGAGTGVAPTDATAPVAMASTGPAPRRLEDDSPVTAVDVSLPGLAATSPRWATSQPGTTAAGFGTGPAVVASASVPLAKESSRESSVEELIDLEQQAEFFVVLGQDDAAIDLLTNHVQGEGGASPLPYLKLLEIHRRRGDREGYKSIRTGFNQRFNAYAPDWDADLQQGRALEDYPEVINLLQRLWVTPSRAMETLDASVFRRDRSDETFDLPAYRELLFLYTIARDQAEQAAAGIASTTPHVDLLLPLGSAADAGEPISHLNATGSGRQPDFEHSARVTLPLDLDVTLAVERLPARVSPLAGAKAGAAAPMVATVAMAAATPGGSPYESAETVPAALRRPVGHPDESAFVDLQLEPVGRGDRAGGR